MIIVKKTMRKIIVTGGLGFIRFGSRTDLIMPSNIKLNVKLGDKVKGGETIIGEI